MRVHGIKYLKTKYLKEYWNKILVQIQIYILTNVNTEMSLLFPLFGLFFSISIHEADHIFMAVSALIDLGTVPIQYYYSIL
jgi:hypothetical protein